MNYYIRHAFFYLYTALPNITTPPMDLTVLAPAVAMLSCSVEGFPLPTVSWVMVDSDGNERPLTNSGENIAETSTPFTITSTLTISPTDITLNGAYRCMASNTLGAVNETAQLIINGEPH